MPKHRKGLSPRQKEFLRQYLLLRNASEAYRISHNYKGTNADVLAAKLLVNASISAELKSHEQRRQMEFEISEKKILDELAAIAFGHIGKVAEWDDEDMNVIPKDKLDESAMKYLDSIEKITIGEDITKVSVKTLANQKVKALQLLGEHIGMWSKDARAGIDQGDRRAVMGRLSEYFRKRKERERQT